MFRFDRILNSDATLLKLIMKQHQDVIYFALGVNLRISKVSI